MRVAEWRVDNKMSFDAPIPERFGSDVRHSLGRNLKEGYLRCMRGSRFYMHSYDRTLAAKEYVLNQGWPESTNIENLHLPWPALKQAKVFRDARAHRLREGASTEEAAETIDEGPPTKTLKVKGQKQQRKPKK